MAELPGVVGVHDLHVWNITSGVHCLSARVVAGAASPADLLSGLRDVLHVKFGIDHLTIRAEPEGFEEGAVHA